MKWIARTLICLILGAATTVGVAWGFAIIGPELTGDGTLRYDEPMTDWSEASEFTLGTAHLILARRSSGLSQSVVHPIFEAFENKTLPATFGRAEDLKTAGDWDGYRQHNMIATFRHQQLALATAIEDWAAAARLTGEPPRANLPPTDVDMTIITARGWPLLSMQARSDYFRPDHRRKSGQLEFRATGQPVTLPLHARLPGFIINTLFYAAIWFVLFFGFGFVKRTIRRKRGRCPRCGYDLRYHHAPCGAGGQPTHAERGATSSGNGCPECGWNRSEPRA